VWKTSTAFAAETARWDHPSGRPVLLAKPTTYMNESGRAARALANYFKLAPRAVAAVYDECNIDLPRVKITTSGSAGGHNGVESLLQELGNGFVRYRIGIGPKEPPQMDLKDFVLGKFTPEQRLAVDQQLPQFLSGLDLLLTDGVDRAMNSINRRETHEPEQP